MSQEHTIKFFLALGPEDMMELKKCLGPWCVKKWWFQEWLRHYGDGLTLSEYRALMEAPPNREPRPTRDWGDEL